LSGKNILRAESELLESAREAGVSERKGAFQPQLARGQMISEKYYWRFFGSE
jgi:hypothetical protein